MGVPRFNAHISGLPDDSAFIRLFSAPIEGQQKGMEDLGSRFKELHGGAAF